MKTLLSSSSHKNSYQFEGNSNSKQSKIGEYGNIDKQNQILSDQNSRKQYTEELGQDKYNIQPANYRQQTTQLRKIDLNRTSNINTILNQQSNNNRSQSRSQSPTQQENGKFISFKKNQTYEQSKQQRFSLIAQQKQEEEIQSGFNNIKNRSKSNLSTSSAQKKKAEKQGVSNSKQNVKIIKLQLEQEKKERNGSSSSRKLINSKQDKLNKGQQEILGIQQIPNFNDDNYDFIAGKNSARGNKHIQQRLSYNDQYIFQGQKQQSQISSPNSKNLAILSNNKNDFSLDGYDKKLQTKIEFNKIDQKFDKKNINVLSSNHSKKFSDFQESQFFEFEEVKKQSKTESNNQTTKDSNQHGKQISYNSKDIDNKQGMQKNQPTEKNDLRVSEFEILEQSILREEQEIKGKKNQSKGISNKKLSNQSSGFSNSNYNNYFSNATPTSDSLKHLNLAMESEQYRKDQRSSSGICPETDNNSLSSSIHRSNDLTNHKLDLAIKSEQNNSKPASSQITSQKPQKVFSVLSLSQQSSSQVQQDTSQTNCTKPSGVSGSVNKNKNLKQINQKANFSKYPSEDIASKLISDNQNDNCFNSNQQTQKKAQSSKRNQFNSNAVSKLPNKNISPTLYTSRSQQQLNYVSECSKKLFQESQEIGINSKSKENIALFKQALETRNKAIRGSGFTSAKAVSPSTRYQEVKKIHSINQNIIINNLQNPQRGSLTSRNNVQDNNNIDSNNNQKGDQSNKHAVSDNNSVTTTTTNATNNCKTQISTPLQKINTNSNSINQILKAKVQDSKQNNQTQSNAQSNKNSSSYFLGNFQSINSIQTTISKTEIGISQNQIDDSHCDQNNIAKSPSQKYYLDYQNKQTKYQPLSPTFKTETKNKNVSKSINKPHQSNISADLSNGNNHTIISHEFTNRKSNNQRDTENRKSDLLASASNTQSYNFINEKSNIINKISGNYKLNEKSNLERSFNLITPSKSTLTRQIQLAANQQENSITKTNEKLQLIQEKERSRDHSLERKQNNLITQRSKSQYKQTQSNMVQQFLQTPIQLDDCSPTNNDYSNKNQNKQYQTLTKDSNTTSLTKIDIKESLNLSKIPTVQTNLTSSINLRGNEKAKSQQLNISNSSLIRQSNNKNNLDIKEVQIQPSQNSTFNFKPSYFTPLNYEDLSDYIDHSKRNSSPTGFAVMTTFKK
ncbi:hypothetical protein TTHERM_00516320 (macronuclear) [Tetrahymena thermophila SB210]|uniref:Uncharacterized protein n=1 Tax=Tetrahymena thermophila (strain SB210) TaxID=312017 RepID=I7MIV3_TETTS|nr:hypothetical protein TTHERM_00516320 [Tetrahymena thermophila SB210]EAR94998.2 hypothetical protein TTHERM_00516320 [Tetrahymena thermophila SB210]|eukprot:XP_001015243.2 hypothetical protein TTHERM_00516320 [Tetrahymena thermophila SB210]